jgi:hypothetical protein
MTSLDKRIKELERVEDIEAYRFVVTREPDLFAATYFDYELDEYQIAMLNFSHDNRRSVILLPKGHGKSTILVRLNTVMELCANPNIRIIIIMKTKEEAGAYSTTIKADLKGNDKLIRDFGNFSSNVWSMNKFDIAQRQINDQHNTVEIYGIGKPSYLGHRCDLVICDDVVNEDNSYTPEARGKLVETFQLGIQTGPQYLWTLKNPNCKWEQSSANLKVPPGISWPKDINYERIVVTGTRFHTQDLYAHLMADSTFKTLHFDCWKDAEQTQPLWPKMWTKNKLDAEKKSLGIKSFNKRYRNIAIDQSELDFNREWVYGGVIGGEVFPGCINRNRSWGEYPDNLFKVTGYDPASGKSTRYSTFPSYVCLGVDKDAPIEQRTRYMIDTFRLQSTDFDDLLDVLLDGNPAKRIPGFRKLYKYDVAAIEVNAYGTMFANNLRMKNAQLQGLRIVEHWTGRNRLDPEDGIYSMQAIFKQGLVDIPYRYEEDQAKAEEFIEQLLLFPQGLTDLLMAFWFAELQIRKAYSPARVIRPKYQSRFGSFKRPQRTASRA